MHAGRARRTIENENLSAPENMSGHNPGHDHGHGNQCPANVMANLCVPMFPEAILEEPWPDNHAPDGTVAGFSGSGKKTETGTMGAMPFNATCQFV